MKKLFLITLSTILLFSCKHELESPTWDVDMILPIAHAKLNINNIISDTATIINEDEEGFISLVFQQEFIDMNLDTLIKIDAIADEQTHTLDSVIFDDVVIAHTATIGEAIAEIPFGTTLFPDGSTNSIPPLPDMMNEDTIVINASEYFETMTLHKGWLVIDLVNNFPTDISNVNMTLKNGNNQETIANFNFPLIPAGSTATDSSDISGKVLDKNLTAIIHKMDIEASASPVLITYSDAIIIQITITDIGITEATAIFPEQQLTETLKEHTFDLSGAQITEIGIKEGTVTINMLSTLPNGKMIYNIPSLTKNGVPFTSGEMIVPQATNTNLTTFDFDFEGYILDLTGQEGRLGGDTVNTIYTESYTFIDSTGILETINHTDSFYSFVDFNLIPEYAKGYIGQDTLFFESEIIETDIFKFVESGSMDLESANISIGINNYIGADAAVQINHLSVLNDNTEVTATLDNTIIYNIGRASISGSNIITPTYTEINIDADEMLEIFPNKINTNSTFYLNPNGQSSIEDFLFPATPIEANIEVEIPLKFIANELTLSNTSDVAMENIEEIEILYISIENGLPLGASLSLITLDEANQVIDTLLVNKNILSALTNAEGKVTESSLSTLEIKNSDFTNIKNINAIASFTTEPQNKHINIYSTYEMDITLSAKFKKTLGN
jgi:hypothetical protein